MSNPQIIQPPNTLKKAKVGVGPAKLDPQKIERAERAIKDMEKDYATWAQADLAALEASLAGLRRAPDSEAARREMFRIALDMKGQGASFGYRLITEIGDLLCKFLESRALPTPFDCDVLAAHVAAMRAVFAQEVRDDGGATGRALIAGLQQLIAKAASQPAAGS